MPGDPRLERLSEICLGLPEAERSDSPPHAGFTVRKRTFAYFLDDHQGDGIVGLVCKLAPGEQETLLQVDPERFYKPAYLHHRGWIGLRLDRGEIDWEEVAALVSDAYVLVAPKRLAAQVS